MRSAFLASVGFHACIIVLVVVGLPELFQREPLEETAMAIEVVTEADTETPPEKPEPPEPRSKPEPPPPKKEAPPPPPPPQAALPEPEPPMPEPPPKPELVPERKAEPAPKPEPEPKKEPPPQVAKAEPAPPAPPAPRPRPTPRPDEFQTLLKNLAREADNQRREEPKPETKPEPPQVRKAAAPEKPPRISEMERQQITEGLADLVKEQIQPCWNIPAGAKGAHTMRIGIRVFLNPDGSVRGHPRIENSDRVNSDPFFRAAAESAVRALLNPRCSPLRLPQEQYDVWQEISFNFDPREVLAP